MSSSSASASVAWVDRRLLNIVSLLFGRAGVPFLVLGGRTRSCGKSGGALLDLELAGNENLLTPVREFELPNTEEGGGPAGVKEAAEDGGGPAGVVEGWSFNWLNSDLVRGS